jgi:hypothetical protein
MGKMKTFYAEAAVDVGLHEWDTGDLLEELDERGHTTYSSEHKEEALKAYYALALGNQTKALELCKELIQNITGRIL